MQDCMKPAGLSRRNWNTGIRETVKWGYAGKILERAKRPDVRSNTL